MPTREEVGEDRDPLLRVKLFGGSRWTFYVAAAEPLLNIVVLTGFCVAEHGREGDQWCSIAAHELVAMRAFRLPVERDIHWSPARLSTIPEYRAAT